MNHAMVKQLVLKDWYLQRYAILAGLAGGVLSLGIIATGGNVAFFFGLILLITALIAVGAQLAVSTMVTERKEQTLAFVMSLPISYREYTASKILGNLIIFLVPWITMLTVSLALLLYAPKTHGLVPYTTIMATEILLSTCLIIAVALMTESQGWTIGAIMVGNIAVNGIGYWVAHIGGIAKGMWGSSVQWSPAASAFLLGEFVTIVLLLGFTFFLQSRKKDFL
jgi:ABC-2 type transport system permease protein